MAAFETGTLWRLVTERTRLALASGALQPIPTSWQLIEDSGMPFVVRRVEQLRRKREVTAQQRSSGTDPFLPWDEPMYVGDASDSHVCLLNKFNVVEHHLLIVTRRFEHQDEALTPADLDALWRCMVEYRALGTAVDPAGG